MNEYWVKLYDQVNSAVEDFAVLFDFWKAGEASEEEAKAAYNKAIQDIEEAEFKSTLNQPEDECCRRNEDNDSEEVIKQIVWRVIPAVNPFEVAVKELIPEFEDFVPSAIGEGYRGR